MTKTAIATLPAGLLVVCWWKRGRLSTKRDVMPLLPFVVAALAAGLDQLVKYLIKTHMKLYDMVWVIKDFFKITYIENSGVAFGMFNESTFQWRTTLLVLVSVVAVVVVSAIIWRARQFHPFSIWGFALVLGGAAGNLFDRIVSGRVTDFLDFYILG